MIFTFIFLCFPIQYSLSEEWTIHVYTGTERFAGTDSSIFIRLFNSKFGYTHEYELTHENWIIGDKLFPAKNLFEYGEHDRFRIDVGKFGFVEKIDVRRDNFPLIRSDWLLDRIIIERNRDSSKFIFKCNCWLRTKQPNITIHVLSDLQSIDKNNSLKYNQTIVFTLIVSISIITCFICFIHTYCRRRDFSRVRTQQQASIVNTYYPQLLPEPSAPPLLNDTINPRGDIRDTLSPYSSTTFVMVRSTVITSTDEPPAYRDLFPD